MSTIDQAFIKAYLQKTALPPETAPQASRADQSPTAAGMRPPQAEVKPAAARGPSPAAPTAAARPLQAGRRQPAASATRAPIEPPPPPRQQQEAEFRPMLQVDGFAWSERATSLRLAAGIQVDRLADGLAAGIADSRKVVAVAGCRRHQGCTTALLCAAKRLVDRGLKVALVDGDFAHPALAARLGLLPDAGLETVLAGRLKLEDVAIESIDDRIVVVPVASPCAAPARSPEGQAILASAAATLRKHFDLVLVDLGEIERRTHVEASAVRAVPRWIDAVVLVQDVRSTPQGEIVAVTQRVRDEGIAVFGVVENFV